MRLNLCWKPCAGSPVRREFISPFCTAADDGYSGTNFDRPDWQRLLGMIDEGRIGTIIVKDMSRLGRDYLQVGMYTEMVFPNNDIRFIAINNGVDSANQVDNDMTPFINIFNEFYAKDTSKKVKAVFRAKGNSGKPLTTNPPYGYLKDPNDKHHWIIDPEAAPVVREMFKMCVAGKGPSQISKELMRRGHSDSLRTYAYTWDQDARKAVGTAWILAATHHSRLADEARILGPYSQFPHKKEVLQVQKDRVERSFRMVDF